jgi:hypothetical protein
MQSNQIKCKISITIDNLHQASIKEIEKIQDGTEVVARLQPHHMKAHKRTHGHENELCNSV